MRAKKVAVRAWHLVRADVCVSCLSELLPLGQKLGRPSAHL